MALLCLVFTALPASPQHALLLREAATAAKANDNATALLKLQQAERLRPDYPRIQINLARIYTALGQVDEAIAALQRLQDMGLHVDVEDDPAFGALKELPDFQALLARARQPAPVVPETDEAAFAIDDVTGIIESCLVDPETLMWYFGDVRNRCVWVRDISTGVGVLKKFTHDSDALDGVFKLALSPDRKTLWASTATAGVMTGADATDGKRSSLVAIDFASGLVRARFPAPSDGHKHLLGDFILAPDGSIFATDSMSPVIWRLPAGGDQLVPWLEHEDFLSLQGLTLAADGRTLFVADYANGIWRIDVRTSAVSRLIPPSDATFFGIDGLYPVPGALLAVQNGVEPQRVLRIEPQVGDISPTTVVATGRPAMNDLSLGQVFNGRFHFVGNSGWALFDPPPATERPPRTVTIYSVSVE